MAPLAALLVFIASVGSLFTAYVAEHFFDVYPCILCIYQRIPYALAAFFALAAIIIRQNDKAARMLLRLAALAFFANMFLAIFHSGVELHWWAGTDECGVNPAVLSNVADLKTALLKQPLVNCDEINFTFLGITMANWNVLASLGLGLFSLMASLGPCSRWANRDGGNLSSCCCRCNNTDNKSCI
jgi:disulfide bond formation protein DsbB